METESSTAPYSTTDLDESSTLIETTSEFASTEAVLEETTPQTTASDIDEPVTITLYTDFGGYTGEQSGYLARIFEEQLGIKLNYVVNSDGQIYNEDGSLKGDICLLSKPDYEEAVEIGAVYDLYEDGFYDKYANSYLKEGIYGLSDTELVNGKLYGIKGDRAYAAEENYSLLYKNCIRWDLYKKLGYPKLRDLNDLEKVLKDMKEICPVNEAGEECYGICMYDFSEQEFPRIVLMLMNTYYGVYPFDNGYYDAKNNKTYNYLSEASCYIKVLEFLNRLYREGLLKTKTDYEEYYRYLESDRVFFSLEDMNIYEYNSIDNLDKGKAMLPIALGDAVNTAYADADSTFKYWCINASSEKKEKCMELIGYLASPEGVLTVNYGPKGLCWEYDEEGNTFLTDYGSELCQNRFITTLPEEWGGGYFNDGTFLANGNIWSIRAENPDSNGEPYLYTEWKSYNSYKGSDIENDWISFTGFTNKELYYLDNEYAKVTAEVLKNYAVPDGEEAEFMNEYTNKAILAGSEEEFEAIISEMREMTYNK